MTNDTTPRAYRPDLSHTPGENHAAHAASSNLINADGQLLENAFGAYVTQADFDGFTVTPKRIQIESCYSLIDAPVTVKDTDAALVQATHLDAGRGMNVSYANEADNPIRPGRDGMSALSENNQGIVDAESRSERAVANSPLPLIETTSGATWDTLADTCHIVEPTHTVTETDDGNTIATSDGTVLATGVADTDLIHRDAIETARVMEIVTRTEDTRWHKFVGPFANDQYYITPLPENDVADILAEYNGRHITLTPDDTGTAVRLYYPYRRLEKERENRKDTCRFKPLINYFWEKRVDQFYGVMDLWGENQVDVWLTWDGETTSGSVQIPKLDPPSHDGTWDDNGTQRPTSIQIDTTFTKRPGGDPWQVRGFITIHPEKIKQVLERDNLAPWDDFDPLKPNRKKPHELFRVGEGLRGIRVSERGFTKLHTLQVVDASNHPSENRLTGHLDTIPPVGEHIPAGIDKQDDNYDEVFWERFREAVMAEVKDKAGKLPRLPEAVREYLTGNSPAGKTMHDVMADNQQDDWEFIEGEQVVESRAGKYLDEARVDNYVELARPADNVWWVAEQKPKELRPMHIGQAWVNLGSVDRPVTKYVFNAWGIHSRTPEHLHRLTQEFSDVTFEYRNAFKHMFSESESEVEAIVTNSDTDITLNELLNGCRGDARRTRQFTKETTD